MTGRFAGLAILVALTAASCGGSDSNKQTLQPSTTPTTTSSAGATGCTPLPSATAQPQTFPREPALTVKRTGYTATIVTNCGTIIATLDAKKAPHTVNSFAFLAAKHFFDRTPCHRLVTSGIHVLQCGDPTGSGSGGPGYTIPDENLSGATYPPGTLAMANTGQPHTGGSQFFLVYGATPLPPQYTPFGQVVTGLDVLTRIAAAGDDGSYGGPGDGKPKESVVIESFRVKLAA